MLALDFSDSIFNAGAVGDIIDAARAFIAQRSVSSRKNSSTVMIAFGRTAAIEVIQDFTQDDVASMRP